MSTRRSVTNFIGAIIAVLSATAPLAAQQGTVAGIVRTEAGEPVAGAQVFIQESTANVPAAEPARGTITQQNGRFLIRNVPVGEWVIRVQLIGYGAQSRDIVVEEGEVTQVDLTLETEAVSLAGIVVTGVIGATEKAKVPFTVTQLGSEELPVPSVSAAQAIQGKVAGATVVSGSGRPGSSPSILLRGATSLDASGRSQEPLYIVDGVILGASISDISSLDIENIEVIKGAAAASLYGSRAANGVIQITTKRGRGLESGDVRYTVRTEVGESDLPGEFLLAQNHPWLLNEEGTAFIDASTGQECAWLDFGAVTGCNSPVLAGQGAAPGETANAWNTFNSNAWPGAQFDQVEQFFTGGTFMENYISATGRQGATNFHVSFSNISNEGIMIGQPGYERQAFRLNVDQTIVENVQVSASASYSRAEEDRSQGALFDLTRQPAGVNLAACEDDPTTPDVNERELSCLDNPEDLLLLSDPTNPESPNPLYGQLVLDFPRERGRFLGSVNLRVSPLDWLDVDANASYDRLDRDDESFYPKGYRTVDPSSLNDGYMYKGNLLTEAFNASVTASGRFQLGENVVNRTQLRYLYEQEDALFNSASAYEFAVADVPVMDNLSTRQNVGSSITSIRSDGYFAITNFDIMDRYILDALVRNDGSSLFGAEQRRQWYYRFAGAWRALQEPWLNIPGVNELKLRYSYGTAGGRPNFYAQYETYSVSGGVVTPVALGNADLRPEFSAEQELGLETLFLDGRLGASLVYANTVTEDQILQVPAPAYTGFNSQWRNAGTLESNTWEATLDARVLSTDNMSWTSRLLWDRTRTEITELTVAPFQYGVGGQGLGNVFYARPGEAVGTFYGVTAATSCADLPEGVSCDGFTVNDDGFLVWVGDDGVADFGESSEVNIRGAPVGEGVPFAGECTDRTTNERTLFCEVGNTLPDYTIGFSNTFRWGGLTLYGLLESVQGFDVYNQPLQWAVFKRTTSLFDSTERPLGYYDALYGVSGLQPSSIFVEDGSFTKLRELALSYRIGGDRFAGLGPLGAFDGLTLSVIGRNLLTWTDYRGYDPEVGEGGGDTGSAALARVDGYQYPNFRTITFGIEANF